MTALTYAERMAAHSAKIQQQLTPEERLDLQKLQRAARYAGTIKRLEKFLDEINEIRNRAVERDHGEAA